MKVTIQKVSLKNFLSVGNNWLTIDFRKGLFRVAGENLDNNTKNGVGKSSVFIDSLMFGLFGKPVRKVNLPDIPNTINNKKGCEVKLWFSVGDQEYLIYRGINPSFLKLYENYVEGDEDKRNNENEIQDSAKKFTQKRIDDLIASNFNTLSHLLIMSNTYTAPFLDLETRKKREIIEDILGVSVFGCMAEKAKDQSLSLKSDLKVSEKSYQITKAGLESFEDNIIKLKQKAEEFETTKRKKLGAIKQRLKTNKDKIEATQSNIKDENDLTCKIDKLKDHSLKLDDRANETKSEVFLSKKVKESNKKILDELKDKPTCPICDTETSSEHVAEHVEKLENELEVALTKIKDGATKSKELKVKCDLINQKINELNDKINENKRNIRLLEDLKLEKDRIKVEVSELNSEKNNFLDLINEDELEDKRIELQSLEIQLEELSTERDYYEYIRKLLSDDGIKNYIIKKVLKFWNFKVNHYLSELNAEFSIHFDELLNAVIKSRNRDPLQYHSFSGGEKARIDVAILLSVIDISKLQNSIDLNVMVIDELLDGGLDDNGREDVLNLFKEMTQKQGKSIYVISHNSNLPSNLFDKEITLFKKGGFTFINK